MSQQIGTVTRLSKKQEKKADKRRAAHIAAQLMALSPIEVQEFLTCKGAK